MTKKLNEDGDMDTSAIGIEELLIADDMMGVVREEVHILKKKGGSRDDRDLMKLEKLAKVYATLMASHRENVKFGVFGNLSGEQLDDPIDGGEGAGAGDDSGDDPA